MRAEHWHTFKTSQSGEQRNKRSEISMEFTEKRSLKKDNIARISYSSIKPEFWFKENGQIREL